MKFWLDWEVHRFVLAIFGAIGAVLGFGTLLYWLPKWLSAWIVLVSALGMVYLLIYSALKYDCDRDLR